MRRPSDIAAKFLARIIPFVDSDGARNLNHISRELGIPYQTLRFRMMRLKDEGISVLAVPDVEKLGLERFRVSFKIVSSVKDVSPLFRGLHETAGLRSYSRTMDSQIFDCEFAVARGRSSELGKLLGNLEELGIVKEAHLKNILWKEIPMLKTQFYDYSKSEWDMDFSSLSGDPSSYEIPSKSEPESIDYSDLVMIKELELNPWIKTVDLARKADLGVGDAAYHLNRHIFARKLIRSFKLTWSGTREAWLKHSIILKTYVFEGISDEDGRHVMSVLSSIPFVWSHMMLEGGTYMAETNLPISQYSEATQYVSSQLRALDLSPSKTFEKDWSCLSTFTIPYMLYNKNRSAWEYSAEHAMGRILQMIRAHSV